MGWTPQTKLEKKLVLGVFHKKCHKNLEQFSRERIARMREAIQRHSKVGNLKQKLKRRSQLKSLGSFGDALSIRPKENYHSDTDPGKKELSVSSSSSDLSSSSNSSVQTCTRPDFNKSESSSARGVPIKKAITRRVSLIDKQF